MKISKTWLTQWVNYQISTEQLADQLTMAGLEVESQSPVAGDFSKVYIGLVESVEPCANSKKLNLCKVKVGEQKLLTIVCGASNVTAGIKVAVATIGAQLPNGLIIQAREVNRIASEGMICAKQELNILTSTEHDGIWILPDDAPLGEDLHSYLELDDTVLELSITPNRADCLSMLGVAREVAVLTNNKLNLPEIKPTNSQLTDTLSINNQAPTACPRYLGRMIQQVDNQRPLPIWLTERLNRSGIRQISSIVDIVNYVMIELGQPLHAFDATKLTGGINIRWAHPNEKLALLDGTTAELSPKVLVIADDYVAHAMAGIMGGADSAVQPTTTSVFLESAFFNPNNISGIDKSYGLHTDSSHRFCRGVDPEITQLAIERATQLILEFLGGQAGPVIENSSTDNLPKSQPITLRKSRIERILGTNIPEKDTKQILTKLGLTLINQNSTSWQWLPPSHRFDLTIEEDLIEEIARIYGYTNLISNQPARELTILAIPEQKVTEQQLSQLLVNLGYQQAITYSFVDSEIQKYFLNDQQPIKLSKPLTSEMSEMRVSLWPGLVGALQYNLHHQNSNIRLFEIGHCFNNSSEQANLALILSGSAYPTIWSNPTREVDFYDLKGDIEQILQLIFNKNYQLIKTEHPTLHPGQSAKILLNGKTIGLIGQMHPKILNQLSIEQPVFLFECQMSALTNRPLAEFKPLSKFPSIKRDISIVVDDKIPFDQIIELCVKNSGNLLQDIYVFDVYQGQGIPEHHRSIALGLMFQHPSRTLTDQEVNNVMENLFNQLTNQLGATLRK